MEKFNVNTHIQLWKCKIEKSNSKLECLGSFSSFLFLNNWAVTIEMSFLIFHLTWWMTLAAIVSANKKCFPNKISKTMKNFWIEIKKSSQSICQKLVWFVLHMRRVFPTFGTFKWLTAQTHTYAVNAYKSLLLFFFVLWADEKAKFKQMARMIYCFNFFCRIWWWIQQFRRIVRQ